MTQPEATVLLAQLRRVTDAIRDLGPDAPAHVVEDANEHIEAINEAARELARIHKVAL